MTPAEPRTPRIRNPQIAGRIERNAVRLVVEHGYDAVTVDQICAAAEVAPRTFFNYYGTKQAAVLGHDLPSLDEAAVRRFLAGDGGLLEGALSLVRPARSDEDDPGLAAGRVQAIRSTPVLMTAQIERFAGVRDEVAEVIALRIRRDRGQDETDAELERQAQVLAEIVAVVLRLAAESAADAMGADGPPGLMDGVAAVMDAVGRLLPKLRSTAPADPRS